MIRDRKGDRFIFPSPSRDLDAQAPPEFMQSLFSCVLLNYGGCVRGTFGCAGFLDPRSSTPARTSTRPAVYEGTGGNRK
jgi:hypothetical protein